MNFYLIMQAILKLSQPIVMTFLLAVALHSLTISLSNAHEPLGHMDFYRRIFLTALTAIFCTITLPFSILCLLPRSFRKVICYV